MMKYFVKFYSFVVFIGTALAISLCLLLDVGEKKIIVLLPVAYFCCYLLCHRNRRYLKNLSLVIINISAFCRYIIYPIIIAVTIHNGGSYRFDEKVVWLLIYELAGVFLMISLFSKKLDVPEKARFNVSASIGIPNALLLAMVLPTLVVFPSLITRFSISSDVTKTVSVPGIVEIVFTMGIWVLFIYMLVFLSSIKYKARMQRILSFLFVVAIALYYIMFNAVSGSDVKRWQIIACGIAMIYIVIQLFPEKKKMVLAGGILGLIGAVYIGSFIKFGMSVSFGNFVYKYLELSHFTEYFGGMRNITMALNAFSLSPSVKGMESTLTDLFSGVPIVSALFDYDSYATPEIFQRYVGRTDIICPLTAQSVIHFGYVGTPALAMGMTYLAITFDSVLKRTKNMYSAYVLIELVVFFSLFMELNTTIILGKLWIRLMFLALQPFDTKTRFKIRWRGV